MKNNYGTSAPITFETRDKLRQIAKHEHRNLTQQLTVIINEKYKEIFLPQNSISENKVRK